MIEAKSHVDEMFSRPTGATEESARIIRGSLEKTRKALRGVEGCDWSVRFYQYANRLAHAYLLHGLNHARARLVFLYFIGDVEMDGPTSLREWKAAISVLHEALGIRGRLPSYVKDVFLEIGK